MKTIKKLTLIILIIISGLTSCKKESPKPNQLRCYLIRTDWTASGQSGYGLKDTCNITLDQANNYCKENTGSNGSDVTYNSYIVNVH